MRLTSIITILFFALTYSLVLEAQPYKPQKSRGNAVSTSSGTHSTTHYDSPQYSGTHVVHYDVGQLYHGLAVGSMAPDLSMPDANGRFIRLSSLRGKYVLLHFWASWCPNSQTQVPNYNLIFNKYKKAEFVDGKGFEPYSISIDSEEYHWKKYTNKFGIIWGANVCDFKEYETQALQTYGVNIIPANYLIDPNGYVIGKDLSLADLDRMLESKAVTLYSPDVFSSDERPLYSGTTTTVVTPQPITTYSASAYVQPATTANSSSTRTVYTYSSTDLSSTTTNGTGYAGSAMQFVSDTYGSPEAYYAAGGYAGGNYKVHLGEFETIPADFAYDLRNMGKTEAVKTSDGTYKILIGTFGSDIRRVLAEIRGKGYTNAYVLELK